MTDVGLKMILGLLYWGQDQDGYRGQGEQTEFHVQQQHLGMQDGTDVDE